MKGTGNAVFMRRMVTALCVAAPLLLWTHEARAEEQGKKIQLVFKENRGTWSGDSSPAKDGGQNLAYFSAGYYADDYGFTVLGSHAATHYGYHAAGANDFNLSALTDSTVSAYYMPGAVGRANLRIGLDVNLPTGHPRFSSAELASLPIDNAMKELNLVTSFGKGFNIAPNAAISVPYTGGSAGAGVRYELTGEYDPTSDVADDRYDPGNILMFFGSLQNELNAANALYFDLMLIMSGKDKQAGTDVFKQGDAWQLAMRYVRGTEDLRVTYGLSYGWQGKNQLYDGGGITTEDRNSNGNYYDLFANGTLASSARQTLNGIVGYKKVQANGYVSTDALYDGGYGKVYIGGGITQYFSEHMYGTADLRLFRLWNADDQLEPGGAGYTGMNVDIGIVYAFSTGE